ncbi:unnamed protein product [Adineta ricciae]|uniref:Uncharacterized protein n=1 Tax=Adineta ricciae TaxID=249248 RepID=A0A815WYN2_ADIRI|nr:unnamed protein product [Adineta ricciae]CAF1660356.1 unnamed protein product [Adineta ricciae]
MSRALDQAEENNRTLLPIGWQQQVSSASDAQSYVNDGATTHPHVITLPIRTDRQVKRCEILREEYCITEDPDVIVNESIQLDESIDEAVSLSSSSSSSSSSYLHDWVQEMIAKYPTEEQLSNMIIENYFNYISATLQDEPVSVEHQLTTIVINDDDDDSDAVLGPASKKKEDEDENDDDQEQMEC